MTDILDSEVSNRLDEVLDKFDVSAPTLVEVKDDFLREMRAGWEVGKGLGAPSSASSIKMLNTHIDVLPRGYEKGVFYALDLGGTYLRVLRVVLGHGEKPEVTEHRRAIPRDVMSSTSDDLFDFIALTAKEMTDKFEDEGVIPAGFTFSFPMSQETINRGTLVEWTKGFSTAGVVGEDPAALLTRAMEKRGVPISVAALCNDTVGTLMTCAYQFEGCGTCKIGMIIGTGTNAAYSDPTLGNLIVNTEWGGYNFRNVQKVLNEYDRAVDEASPNPGKQLYEKTISGMYLGELTRLACLDVLEGYAANKQLPDFLTKGPLDAKFVCAALEDDGLNCDDQVVRVVFRTIGDAVVERSANLCAAGLAAVAEKCGIGRENKRHMREVCVDHGMPRCLTIGVDGSLYLKGYQYPDRLSMAFSKIVGDVMASLIHTVHSSDGSGVGAALMAAAVSQ